MRKPFKTSTFSATLIFYGGPFNRQNPFYLLRLFHSFIVCLFFPPFSLCLSVISSFSIDMHYMIYRVFFFFEQLTRQLITERGTLIEILNKNIIIYSLWDKGRLLTACILASWLNKSVKLETTQKWPQRQIHLSPGLLGTFWEVTVGTSYNFLLALPQSCHSYKKDRKFVEVEHFSVQRRRLS